MLNKNCPGNESLTIALTDLRSGNESLTIALTDLRSGNESLISLINNNAFNISIFSNLN